MVRLKVLTLTVKAPGENRACLDAEWLVARPNPGQDHVARCLGVKY
jgi:hypothetical protein